jgi:predicted RecB family nuclease
MPPKEPGPSSVPLTRRLRTSSPPPSLLPYGVDRQSSRQDLRKALSAIREKLRQDPPDDERDHLEEQLDEVKEFLVRRKDIVKRQKSTRQENKKAARLKRMGGLPPLSREPSKPTKPGKHPPKK